MLPTTLKFPTFPILTHNQFVTFLMAVLKNPSSLANKNRGKDLLLKLIVSWCQPRVAKTPITPRKLATAEAADNAVKSKNLVHVEVPADVDKNLAHAETTATNSRSTTTRGMK